MTVTEQTILITGAGGWLGSLLPSRIVEREPQVAFKFILADIVEPKPPKSLAAEVRTMKADLSEQDSLDALFATDLGKPDVIYSMHGIMSLGSEENWDLGMKVNFDSTRLLLEKARHTRNSQGGPIRFIFTSSVATYGGELPHLVLPSTACQPEGAYGTAKLMGEYLVTEYSRRGFIDGLSVKLPTIVPRPGAPSRATSAFVSGIVREPLNGVEAVCPVGSSIDDPALDKLEVWVAKPSTTLENLARAKDVVVQSADRITRWSRSVQLPGFTVSIRQIIEALRTVRGDGAVALIRFEDDETCRRVVSSWPREFDNGYALGLGFTVDQDGFAGAIREYMDAHCR
ncbi:uncharacterized protein PFL1_04461 [Pseudozyma flocculosa PF-1]|uniref:Related to nucleoside-diphosphate-sugar epimerase n=2 Tax=Pseudozyma flocculosa TaxID=84751 RepID=A0A5C3FCQ4_9BASI|nr:uncharacterized protein PFL1_04461 [Pseudozyma flocculosa PF-1]EPQ28134.1 hypothetical protein PFL1_04461 [Pseudozyma flocculosa PF-1]SPO41936.1 related to nucleoside-diphosphate-sugar epimerase [Pseudozyma flocculosa]